MIDFLIDSYKDASTWDIILEAIAFIFGVLSVWFAKKENIWVYPTGLICTLISMYLLYQAQYLGDMMINAYYSLMSIYGWVLWSLKKGNEKLLHISYTTPPEKWVGLLLFLLTMGITYGVYRWFGYPMEALNYVDIFTSGVFFTAMWYMANKKIENWILWIIGDAITIPLYAERGLGMLALQYVIFLALAISAYRSWLNIYKEENKLKSK